MDGRMTYLDLEALFIRARVNGQEGLAFHLAMARDLLLEEAFGKFLRLHPGKIEEVVRREMQGGKEDE